MIRPGMRVAYSKEYFFQFRGNSRTIGRMGVVKSICVPQPYLQCVTVLWDGNKHVATVAARYIKEVITCPPITDK